MDRLPREARDGLMRAWLGVLRDRHPQVTWVAVDRQEGEQATSLGEEDDEVRAETPELQAVA
jgi:hypothetical protein